MRSIDRKRQLGEVFTPRPLVDELLDQLNAESFTDPTKTHCDPSCGSGNFLVEVIRRKVQAGSTPEQALRTTYGVDIDALNVFETRARILKVTSEVSGQPINLKWLPIVTRNIVQHDALTYDWSFSKPLFRNESEELAIFEKAQSIEVW